MSPVQLEAMARVWLRARGLTQTSPRQSTTQKDFDRSDAESLVAMLVTVERTATERAAAIVLEMDPTNGALRVLASRIRAAATAAAPKESP
jgi:DNA-binding GntR family transcriptional regulator